MKLNFEQIKSITTGAVHIEEENNGIAFFRFTKEQSELYRITNENFYNRVFATAGVRFMFKTDSKSLRLSAVVERKTSRCYFSFDVFANEKSVGYMDNFSGVELPENYTETELPMGEFTKEFDLGEGEKTVCVYFPWSVIPWIRSVEIDDGAYINPVKRAKKLLAFGDSITQGYDALRSSGRYVSILADKLSAEELNKGIGGEIFFPALAEIADDISPDYVTVAYGTNDWSKTTEEDFKVRCRKFYKTLSEKYPDAKIFAITPIWRKDNQNKTEFGAFENVEKDIREAVSDLSNVTLIGGLDLVPHDEKFYADLRLHPNDAGFVHYAENLYKKLNVDKM